MILLAIMIYELTVDILAKVYLFILCSMDNICARLHVVYLFVCAFVVLLCLIVVRKCLYAFVAYVFVVYIFNVNVFCMFIRCT